MKTKQSIVVVLALVATSAFAQTTTNITTDNLSSSIVVPEYTDAQLSQANCDKNTWNSMVDDYKNKATSYNSVAEKALVANQMQGTPSPYANCFDQAASAINSAMSAFNTIKSILTGGGMDSQQLLDYAKKAAVGAACSQVNNYLASSGLSSSISGATSGTVGSVLNTGTTIAGQNVSVGSVISAAGGSTNQPTTAGVNGQSLASGASSLLGNSSVVQSLNPFK